MDRDAVWDKWYREGIIDNDQDLLQMKYELVAALRVCRSIIGFDLASNALMLELQRLEGIISARGIDDEYMPDGDKVLANIKVPKVKRIKR